MRCRDEHRLDRGISELRFVRWIDAPTVLPGDVRGIGRVAAEHTCEREAGGSLRGIEQFSTPATGGNDTKDNRAGIRAAHHALENRRDLTVQTGGTGTSKVPLALPASWLPACALSGWGKAR